MPVDPISEVAIRVLYADTDQMGVAHHARYAVWLETARTEHLRRTGTSYRELEAAGVFLTVTRLTIRFRSPARYDDMLRVRCWVRELASRAITFGYAIDREGGGALVATAETDLIALNRHFAITRLPHHVSRGLTPVPDPVRI